MPLGESAHGAPTLCDERDASADAVRRATERLETTGQGSHINTATLRRTPRHKSVLYGCAGRAGLHDDAAAFATHRTFKSMSVTLEQNTVELLYTVVLAFAGSSSVRQYHEPGSGLIPLRGRYPDRRSRLTAPTA